MAVVAGSAAEAQDTAPQIPGNSSSQKSKGLSEQADSSFDNLKGVVESDDLG